MTAFSVHQSNWFNQIPSDFFTFYLSLIPLIRVAVVTGTLYKIVRTNKQHILAIQIGHVLEMLTHNCVSLTSLQFVTSSKRLPSDS